MAVERAQVLRLPAVEADPMVARLRAELDMEALIEVGYDPERQVFAPSREHPIFGFTECAVRDCPGLAAQAGDLCGPCARRWRGVQPAGCRLRSSLRSRACGLCSDASGRCCAGCAACRGSSVRRPGRSGCACCARSVPTFGGRVGR